MPTFDAALEAYIRATFAHEDEVLARIREQIPARGLPNIMLHPEEGQFLQFLVAVSGALRAVEIGTLGGYSGVWIARGLPPDGRLITLEVSPEHAAVAQEHFALAELNTKVELRIGDAHELLPKVQEEGPVDFVFIDAEKSGYPAYLEWALSALRRGGVLAAHNAFGLGKVSDPAEQDKGTEIIRQFNRRVAEHPDLIPAIYPAGDGMAVAVRIG